MKYLIIIINSIFLLTSCGQEKNTDAFVSDSKNELQIDSINELQLESEVIESSNEIPTDLINYFQYFQGDSIKIEVDEYAQGKRFAPSECLPLTYSPILGSHIFKTQSKSTGAKPVGRIKINDNYYFLVVAQQYDYGPIYIGLTYIKNENKIQKSETVAEIWGDAGDSQITFSIISVVQGKISIEKYIKTCHADLKPEGDKMVETNTDCSDSTATIELEMNRN